MLRLVFFPVVEVVCHDSCYREKILNSLEHVYLKWTFYNTGKYTLPISPGKTTSQSNLTRWNTFFNWVFVCLRCPGLCMVIVTAWDALLNCVFWQWQQGPVHSHLSSRPGHWIHSAPKTSEVADTIQHTEKIEYKLSVVNVNRLHNNKGLTYPARAAHITKVCLWAALVESCCSNTRRSLNSGLLLHVNPVWGTRGISCISWARSKALPPRYWSSIGNSFL